jgi:hypothetical protein
VTGSAAPRRSLSKPAAIVPRSTFTRLPPGRTVCERPGRAA